jgi:DNA-binding GntR family transcriptional regulator
VPQGETDRARIARTIREQIADGRLRPGDRIPSAADLAQQHGVHQRTVQFALSQLKADGLITTHFGKGSFVADVLPDFTPDPTLGEAMRRIHALEARMDRLEQPGQ